MTSLVGNRGMQSTGSQLRGMSTGDKIPKGYRAGQLQQFTPEQMGLFQQLFGNVSPQSFTGRLAGGDQSMFGEIEAPALKQFSELQGNLASRFSGMGSTGARRSSGFQNIANQAATDFAQQLQSQRQALQRQAIQDLFGMSDQLLGQRPYERLISDKQKKQGGLGGILGAGLGGLGGFFTGGPGGALAGANLGYGIGSQF